MTKFSTPKLSFAAFGGIAVLMLVASAMPAAASMGDTKFRATPEELRRHCWRIDETFWMSKRRYGCGEIFCRAGECRRRQVVYEQPVLRKGDGGNGGVGSNGRGSGRRNQGSGAAGAAAK